VVTARLAVVALAVAAALAAWTVLAPAPAVDGRGVLVGAIAAALVLAVWARRGAVR